jgi:hypothetical protein
MICQPKDNPHRIGLVGLDWSQSKTNPWRKPMSHPFDDAENFRPLRTRVARLAAEQLALVIDQLPPREQAAQNNSQRGLQPDGEKD